MNFYEVTFYPSTGAIMINEPSAPKHYKFKVRNPAQICFSEIMRDLDRKHPLIFVDVEKETYAIIHESLQRKAFHLNFDFTLGTMFELDADEGTVFLLNKGVQKSEVIEWAKKVKHAEWPEPRRYVNAVVSFPKI